MLGRCYRQTDKELSREKADPETVYNKGTGLDDQTERDGDLRINRKSRVEFIEETGQAGEGGGSTQERRRREP